MSRHIRRSALAVALKRDASRVDVLTEAAERGFTLEGTTDARPVGVGMAGATIINVTVLRDTS
jgi:hypothetical protein